MDLLEQQLLTTMRNKRESRESRESRELIEKNQFLIEIHNFLNQFQFLVG